MKAYRALRQRYYGSGAYDFGEGQLNIAAFRLGRVEQVRRGARGAAAQRGVLPEFIGDVRVPGERAADEGGYGRSGDGVSRGDTSGFDEQ